MNKNEFINGQGRWSSWCTSYQHNDPINFQEFEDSEGKYYKKETDDLNYEKIDKKQKKKFRNKKNHSEEDLASQDTSECLSNGTFVYKKAKKIRPALLDAAPETLRTNKLKKKKVQTIIDEEEKEFDIRQQQKIDSKKVKRFEKIREFDNVGLNEI